MQIRCLVEREGNRHVLRVEGIPYTFERNEHGHLITDVTNGEHIHWMMRSTSYQAYAPPKIIQEAVQSAVESADLAPEPEQIEEAPAAPKPMRKRGRR